MGKVPTAVNALWHHIHEERELQFRLYFLVLLYCTAVIYWFVDGLMCWCIFWCTDVLNWCVVVMGNCTDIVLPRVTGSVTCPTASYPLHLFVCFLFGWLLPSHIGEWFSRNHLTAKPIKRYWSFLTESPVAEGLSNCQQYQQKTQKKIC